MIHSTTPAKGSGAVAAAIALVLVMATTGAGHAEYRMAGHPAYMSAVPRPPMRPLSTGTVVAGPAAQAQPRIAPPAAPVAADRAGNQGRERQAFSGGVVTGVIVAGVPSGYYYGPATYYAPGYYGDQYTDGGPAVGPSPLPDTSPPPDNGVTYCMQTYSSYDLQSGTFIGDDGKEHPCP